jgi:Raf kinase inhibitor-like YbhB/YbcL family protein
VVALAAAAASLVLTSPAFVPGGTIPARYTCVGRDVSPPLRWSAPPPGTRALQLKVVDLDANGFVHWDARAIPASGRGLATGAHAPVELVNAFERKGWSGPCPPPGSGRHRYLFTLTALSARGRVLARARLLGLFGR